MLCSILTSKVRRLRGSPADSSLRYAFALDDLWWIRNGGTTSRAITSVAKRLVVLFLSRLTSRGPRRVLPAGTAAIEVGAYGGLEARSRAARLVKRRCRRPQAARSRTASRTRRGGPRRERTWDHRKHAPQLILHKAGAETGADAPRTPDLPPSAARRRGFESDSGYRRGAGCAHSWPSAQDHSGYGRNTASRTPDSRGRRNSSTSDRAWTTYAATRHGDGGDWRGCR